MGLFEWACVVTSLFTLGVILAVAVATTLTGAPD
jgi:hypothetical protein